MKIVVEAMCAEFAGIRVLVEHLLAAWVRTYPEDEVHVLMRADSTLELDPRIHQHRARVPRMGPLARPWVQTRRLPRLVREVRPDAVLATLPSTTVRPVDAPMGVILYDLRHRLRPEQFTRTSRLLRAVSYRRGYQLADGFISISQRSLDDLHRLHPELRHTPATVAHLGADHVDAWSATPGSGPAVAFAHHGNKNLDLILDGWQHLVERAGTAPELIVLGLGAQRRAALDEELRRRGLAGTVRLSPFLPDAEFHSTFAAASMIVFPSDFEGFGLPVAEGLRLGIPVVIGPEPATQEVAAGHAVVMRDWTPQALAEAVETARQLEPEAIEAARRRGAGFTWADTATRSRELLLSLIGPRPGA